MRSQRAGDAHPWDTYSKRDVRPCYALSMIERVSHQDEPPKGIFVDGAWRRDWYEAFEDTWFADWLREQGITVPLFEIGNGLYRAIERAPEGKRALPAGHWYKGGQARSRLLRRFGIPCPTPRDVDLIRDETIALYKSPASALLNEADHIEPYGGLYEDEESREVFLERDLTAYFEERDFTVNQVLANGREIIFTKEALIAAVSGTLNPTPFEWEVIEHSDMQAVKQLARALRFSIEWSVDPSRPWHVHPYLIKDVRQEQLDAHPFYIFLHLDRILERGYAYGVQFLLKWQEFGFFRDVHTVLDLAAQLAKGIWGNYRPSSEYLQNHAHELTFGPTDRPW